MTEPENEREGARARARDEDSRTPDPDPAAPADGDGTDGEGRDHLGEEIVSPGRARELERPGWIRRMYDWVLSWAETRYGTTALFVLAFAEASFFPIPPDPLLIALALGAPKRALWFAGICTLGSVLGGIAGYAIGWGLWSGVDQFFYAYVPGVSEEAFSQVQNYYNTYDFWAVFVAGFTPLPYKVFALSAGVFEISLPVFALATVLSRGLRFFVLAGLIYYFGPGIQRFIDRYFDRLAWLFLILLVGGFVVINLVL